MTSTYRQAAGKRKQPADNPFIKNRNGNDLRKQNTI